MPYQSIDFGSSGDNNHQNQIDPDFHEEASKFEKKRRKKKKTEEITEMREIKELQEATVEWETEYQSHSHHYKLKGSQ